MIGIPVAEFATGRLGSPIWDVLAFTMLGAGVVLLILVPRISAGWARRLLARELSQSSAVRGALVEVAAGRAPAQLAVLLADPVGMRLVGHAGQLWAVDWAEVAELRVVNKSAVFEAPVIAAFASDGTELQRFLPIRSGGWSPVSVWNGDALYRDLERRRAKRRT